MTTQPNARIVKVCLLAPPMERSLHDCNVKHDKYRSLVAHCNRRGSDRAPMITFSSSV